MFVSKKLTLSRPEVINKLLSKEKKLSLSTGAVGTAEYFYIGLPPTRPITPEGSILIILRLEFLHANISSFRFGSLGDTGGVKLGHFDQLPPFRANEMRLSADRFLDLMAVIDELSTSEKTKLAMHQPVRELLKAARHILPNFLYEALLNTERQDLWSLEFSLKENFVIDAKKVAQVFIPNTMMLGELGKFLIGELGDRVMPYNPRYSVIEHASSEKHIHSWLH